MTTLSTNMYALHRIHDDVDQDMVQFMPTGLSGCVVVLTYFAPINSKEPENVALSLDALDPMVLYHMVDRSVSVEAARAVWNELVEKGWNRVS
jgi:hypothetical protein